MRDREEDKKSLLSMKHNERVYIAFSEDGGGEVHRIHNIYVLFEIPRYGGIPRYRNTFFVTQCDELLEVAYRWT